MVELLEQPDSVRRRRLWSIVRVPRLARANAVGECFVCDVVDGPLRSSHHIVHEDDETIAFLAKRPPLWGTTLVCPKTHVEDVVADQSLEAYLRVQRTVHRVGRAIEATVPCERLYVLAWAASMATPTCTGTSRPFHQVSLPSSSNAGRTRSC